MKILIQEEVLQSRLEKSATSYQLLSSQSAKQANHTLIQELLHELLEMPIPKPEQDDKTTGFILLAHISGLKLYLSLDDTQLQTVRMDHARKDYKVNDENFLFALQGWRQLEFLTLFIIFQLDQYFKNIIKLKEERSQSTQSVDRNAYCQVLAEELWITINAMRMLIKQESLFKPRDSSDDLLKKQEEYLTDLIEDMQSLDKGKEILIPAGISDGHAIYLSLFIMNGKCEIRIFNAGYGSKSHKSDATGTSKQIYPKYVGTVELSHQQEEFKKYLGQICKYSYTQDFTNLSNAEQGVIFNAIYGNKVFPINKTAEAERLFGFPEQKGEDTCVTYSFFAWLYCRNGRLSILNDEVLSTEDSVYNQILGKLSKFAMGRDIFEGTNQSNYAYFLSKRIETFKNDKDSKKEANDEIIRLAKERLYEQYQELAKITYLFDDLKLPPIPIERAPRLALVLENEVKEKEQAQKEKTKDDERGDYREERLASFEELYGTKKPIELKKLFEKQHEKDEASNRILILGRAGIGKTTLCQYIAHKWSQGQLWNDRYDWVFWIPLRNFRQQHYLDPEKAPLSMASILKQECWAEDPTLDLSILDKIGPSNQRVLLLLDGYDEIAELDKELHPIGKWLKQALAYPHVIITSRPHASPPGKMNKNYKTLENIGFLKEDIEDYVDKFFETIKKPDLKLSLLSYLKQNRNAWGLSHIPINLELICLWWTDKRSEPDSKMTMTSLYDALILKLCKRYLIKRKINPFGSDDLNAWNDIIILNKCAKVLNFLSELAIQAFEKKNAHILINNDLVQHVINQQGEDENLLRDILEAGFLKTSGKGSYSKQDVYFLHLTFQEYFAAYHIKNRFIKKDPTIYDFMMERKYYVEYEIIWWFVAGLLKEVPEKLSYFFELLEQEPKDLGQLYHQLLRMRCLDECEMRLDKSKTIKYIDETKKWISEDGIKNDSFKNIVNTLSISPNLFNYPALYNHIIFMLNSNERTRITALKLLLKQQPITKNELTDKNNIKNALIELIKKIQPRDKYDKINIYTINALNKQYNLLDIELELLLSLFENQVWQIRYAAAKVISQQSDISKVSWQLLSLIEKPSTQEIKDTAITAFSYLPILPPNILKYLGSLLENNQDENVKYNLLRILNHPSSWSDEEVLKIIVSLLGEDNSTRIKELASIIIANMNKLSNVVLNILLSLLDIEKDKIYVIKSLSNRSALCEEEVFSKLTSFLSEENEWIIRYNTAKSLANYDSLPKEVLLQLSSLLEEDGDIRNAASVTLRQQSTIFEEKLLQKLKSLLSNDKSKIREYAAKALINQPNLPEYILTKLKLLLNDKNNDVQCAAVSVLGKQSISDQAILNSLLPLLKNSNEKVKLAVINVLGNQLSVLAEDILLELASLIAHKDEIRTAAIEVLKKHSNMSIETLQKMALLLNDDNKMGVFVDILAKQSFSNILNIIQKTIYLNSFLFIPLVTKIMISKLPVYFSLDKSEINVGNIYKIRFKNEEERLFFISEFEIAYNMPNDRKIIDISNISFKNKIDQLIEKGYKFKLERYQQKKLSFVCIKETNNNISDLSSQDVETLLVNFLKIQDLKVNIEKVDKGLKFIFTTKYKENINKIIFRFGLININMTTIATPSSFFQLTHSTSTTSALASHQVQNKSNIK